MNVKEMVRRRNDLVAERDVIQAEITSLWDDIKTQFFKSIVDLGVFDHPWKYMEDIAAFSFKPEVLFLQNAKLSEQACSLAKEYDDHPAVTLAVGDGLIMIFRYNYPGSTSVEMVFEHKSNPADLIRKYGIKVDFSWLDNKQEELNQKKKFLIG